MFKYKVSILLFFLFFIGKIEATPVAPALKAAVSAQTAQQQGMNAALLGQLEAAEAERKLSRMQKMQKDLMDAVQSSSKFVAKLGSVRKLITIISDMYCLFEEILRLSIANKKIGVQTCFGTVQAELYSIRMESQILTLVSLTGELVNTLSGSQKSNIFKQVSEDTNKLFKDMAKERTRLRKRLLGEYVKNSEISAQRTNLVIRMNLLKGIGRASAN